MSDTLKARLGRLQSLHGLADELQIKIEEKEFGDAEVRILREFYAQDQLAYAVAGGKESYTTKIQFIEEKYSTLWKKAFAPRRDEAFDQEVFQVIGSINGVGEYRDLLGKDYINPKLFTTDGRNRYTRNIDLLAFGVGSVFGLLGGWLAYGTTVCYGTAMRCYEKDTGSALMTSFASMMLPMFYGMAKFNHCVSMSCSLDNLKDAAQKTDEFLRKNYV